MLCRFTNGCTSATANEKVAQLVEAARQEERAACAAVARNFMSETIAQAIETRVEKTNEFETVDHLKSVLAVMVWRLAGVVSFTKHDIQRATRFQLRWTNDGHRTEIRAVGDT